MLVRLCLVVILPFQRVFYGSINVLFAEREYILDGLEQGYDDEVHETGLVRHNACGVTIAQEGHRQAAGFLIITLGEEFLKEQVDPVVDNFEVAGAVAQITGVKAHFEQLLLGFKGSIGVCLVYELVSIILLGRDVFVLNTILELREVLHVLGHVRA